MIIEFNQFSRSKFEDSTIFEKAAKICCQWKSTYIDSLIRRVISDTPYNYINLCVFKTALMSTYSVSESQSKYHC